MYAKCDDSNLSRSSDTTAGIDYENVSRDADHALLRVICHPYAGLDKA